MTQQADETTLTATLPNLTIAIRHRDEGAAGEMVSIQMRAVPNAQAVLPALTAAMPWALASAGPWPANPLAWWLAAAESMWRSWPWALPVPGVSWPERCP